MSTDTLTRRIRRVRWSLRRRWDQIRAPWPIVNECHGHRPSTSGDDWCAQCGNTHAHKWAAWPNAPRWVTAGPGVPIRCRRCGARKCDHRGCVRRRHDHTHAEVSA